jgi:tRNA threonylcarbamoyladenosine biosynthesis protein TsaB
VLAYGQPITDVNLAAVLKSGRGRLAVAWYRAEAGKWKSKNDLENLTHEELVNRIEPPTTICGEVSKDLARKVTEHHEDVFIATPALSMRRPSFLAELAWKKWKGGEADDPRTLKPIYLHHGKPIPE